MGIWVPKALRNLMGDRPPCGKTAAIASEPPPRHESCDAYSNPLPIALGPLPCAQDEKGVQNHPNAARPGGFAKWGEVMRRAACALGLHRPDKDQVKWDGAHYRTCCALCATTMQRVSKGQWKVTTVLAP